MKVITVHLTEKEVDRINEVFATITNSSIPEKKIDEQIAYKLSHKPAQFVSELILFSEVCPLCGGVIILQSTVIPSRQENKDIAYIKYFKCSQCGHEFSTTETS